MRETSRSTADNTRSSHPSGGRDPATAPGKKKPGNPAPRKNTAAGGTQVAGRDPATGKKPGVGVETLGRDPATKTSKR
jgi:hypothetical protein